jgi:hypothetical protein
MSEDETDPVDEINYALWGEVDDAARRAAERVAAEGPDGPTAARLAAHRRLREVLERIEAGRAPPELKEWLLRAVGERRPAPADVDVSWISATPMAMPTSLRGAATERLFSAAFDGGELRAQVHAEEGGAACAVTGRLLGPDRKSLAGRAVELFVDRGPIESAVTDEQGEFAFDARRGSEFGVRVGDGAGAVHVSLIDLRPSKGDGWQTG